MIWVSVGTEVNSFKFRDRWWFGWKTPFFSWASWWHPGCCNKQVFRGWRGPAVIRHWRLFVENKTVASCVKHFANQLNHQNLPRVQTASPQDLFPTSRLESASVGVILEVYLHPAGAICNLILRHTFKLFWIGSELHPHQNKPVTCRSSAGCSCFIKLFQSYLDVQYFFHCGTPWVPLLHLLLMWKSYPFPIKVAHKLL